MTVGRSTLSFIPPGSTLAWRLGSRTTISKSSVSLNAVPFMKETLAAVAASNGSYVTPDPLTFCTTLLLVTGSDMVPFVPCQPLAIALGSKMGMWAFPICVLGQTLAGILAFLSARSAADSKRVQSILDSLGPKAKAKFEDFRMLGSSTTSGELTALVALIGLRLAPFFPFSAGNYLLGGATGVGLRPFIIATILGCLLSNFLSVGIGMGGSEMLLRGIH